MKYVRLDINNVVITTTNTFFDECIEANDTVELGMIYQDGIFIKTFNQSKAEKLISLNESVNARFKAYLAKYPEVEVQSFAVKSAESAKVAANPDIPLTDTPYLSALTNNDITARNSLAEDVNAKVKENAELEAFAVQTRDAIKACKTQVELDAIII